MVYFIEKQLVCGSLLLKKQFGGDRDYFTKKTLIVGQLIELSGQVTEVLGQIK